MNSWYSCLLVGFLLIINIFVNSIQGQEKFTGVVLDSTTGEPIEDVLVIIRSQESDSLLAIEMTDKRGVFLARKSSLSVEITLSQTGSNPISIKRKKLLSDRHTFSYVSSHVIIKEVIVESELIPEIINNDTTRLNLDYYRDSTDHSMLDLLEKIPGFEIKGSGKLVYNGKAIERVLVEGDDLFGANYDRPVELVNNNLFKQVEIIENYNDNPVLGKYYQSDIQILNLLLKEDRKVSISGELSANYGLSDNSLVTSENSLFQFSPNVKSILIAEGGNHYSVPNPMGSNDIKDNFRSYSNNSISGLFTYSRPVLRNRFLNQSLLDDSKKYSLVSRSTINLDNRLKLKIGVSHYNYSYNQLRQSFTDYIFQDSLANLDFGMNSDVQHKYFSADAEIQFYDKKKENNFFISFKYKYDPIDQKIMNVSLENSNEISQNSFNARKVFDGGIEHTTLLGKDWVLKNYVNYSNMSKSIQSRDSSLQESFLFPLHENNQFRMLQQDIFEESKSISINSSFMRIKNSSNTNISLFFDSKSFDYDLGIKSEKMLLSERINEIKRHSLGIDYQILWKFSNVTDIRFGLNYSYIRQAIGFSSTKGNHYHLPSININFEHDLSYKWKLVSSMTLRRKLQEPIYYSTLAYYSSFNTFYNGADISNAFFNGSLSLKIMYDGSINSHDSKLSIIYAPWDYTMRFNYFFQENLQILTPVFNRSKTLSTAYVFQKFLKSFKTKLTIVPSYRLSEYNQNVQDDTYLIRTSNYGFQIKTEFRILKRLLVEMKSQYSYGVVDNGNSQFSNNNLLGNLSIGYEIREFESKFEFLNLLISNIRSTSYTPSLNIKFNYEIKNIGTPVTLKLSLYNLLNKDFYRIEEVDNQTVNGTRIELIPFHFLAGIKFKF